MADRITHKQINIKVGYLSRRLGVMFATDYYNISGSSYAWKLQEVRNGHYCNVTSYRMTTREFWSYLNGMIDCIDGYATAGV